MSTTTMSREEKAAAKIVESTRAGQTPPRKLYMKGYNKKRIAEALAKSPGGMLYGANKAENFVPQAPVQARPGFYRDKNKSHSFVDGSEDQQIAAPSTEEKTKITLNVIELMTENQKLSKSAVVERLDEIRPGHGLEAQNKAVVVAALTQAQIEDSEK